MKATLYALTALVTGLHNSYGLVGIVMGGSIDPLSCVAFLGSASLIGAAILVVRSQPQTAAKVGIFGSTLLWVFYAPLVVVSFLMPFSASYDLRDFIALREYVPLVGIVLGPPLLAISTVDLGLSLRHISYHSGLKGLAQH